METDNITIFKPNQRQDAGFLTTWILLLRNIIESRYIIFQLFKRDFLMQYKKSFLGFGWLFISPLVGIASWVLLNAAGVLNAGETDIPYPAFVLLSTSIYGLFMGFYSSSAGTLQAGQGFINQVNYPHEALLAKQIMQQLANFSIVFVLNIVVLLVLGVTPAITIVLFPLLIIPLFFLGAAFGLIISMISVVAPDISNIVGTLLGFLMYITPVVFTLESIENELLHKLMQLNPLTYLVGVIRDLTLYGQTNYLVEYLFITFVSAILFLLTWRSFYISENRIIEKMF